MAGFANPLPNDAQRDDPRYKKPLSFLQLPGQTQQQQGAPPPIVSPAQSVPQSGSQPVDPKVLNATPHQQELSRLTTGTTGKSGIEQIKNPILRTLGRIGDVALSTALPSAAIFTPGTELHHRALVNQASRNVGTDEDIANNASKRGLESAQTAEQASLPEYHGAMADAAAAKGEAAMLRAQLAEPHDEGKTITTDQGIMQFNPETKRYDISVGRSPDKSQGTVHQLEDGSFIIAHPDGSATPVTVNGKPAKGKGPADKEPTRDDHAIAIYSKPPAQRTPEDNAYLKGYEKYVDVSKVQPGIMRMEVMANNRPVQVVDPNNPQNVVYANAKDAMGQQAPSSIPFQTTKALQQDFTSGTDARTLTAINTAHEHISQLLPLVDALKNGDTRLINQIGNAYAKQTGSPAPASFQLVKTAVLGEIAKTFTGGVATVEEGKQLGDAINAADSPDSLKQALNAATHLMGSKLSNLQTQYTQGSQGKPNFGGSNALPGGITLDDIDKEIQRRKGGK